MGIRIFAGSTVDLPKGLRDRLVIVPLMVRFGDEEFIDGVTIKQEEFYNRLESSDVPPTTSQPSPNQFREEYEKALKDGDEVIVITVSSKLSGTYQSAVLGAEGMNHVHIIDSKSAAIGEGALCELALRLLDEGKSAEEMVEILERERENIIIVAIVDTLEYLERGGRISKTSAFFGGLLSIKPVLTARDGLIVPLGKARGIKNANNLLIKEIERVGGIDFDKPLVIGYTGNDDEQVKKYIQNTKEIWQGNLDDPEFVCMGSVIGTHAGPGAVGIAFYKKVD